MEYIEINKAEDEALSKLKKDYPMLIRIARGKVEKNDYYSVDNILRIDAHYMFNDDLGGHRFSGSGKRTIYLKNDAPPKKSSEMILEKKAYIGAGVSIGETFYHLEIVISAT